MADFDIFSFSVTLTCLFLLNHLKMPECIKNCLPLILRTLRRTISPGLGKIVVFPFYYPAFSFDLGYVKVCYLQAILLKHVEFDFFVSYFCFRPGYLKLGNIKI